MSNGKSEHQERHDKALQRSGRAKGESWREGEDQRGEAGRLEERKLIRTSATESRREFYMRRVEEASAGKQKR